MRQQLAMMADRDIKQVSVAVDPGALVFPEGAGKLCRGHAVPLGDLGQPVSQVLDGLLSVGCGWQVDLWEDAAFRCGR